MSKIADENIELQQAEKMIELICAWIKEQPTKHYYDDPEHFARESIHTHRVRCWCDWLLEAANANVL